MIDLCFVTHYELFDRIASTMACMLVYLCDCVPCVCVLYLSSLLCPIKHLFTELHPQWRVPFSDLRQELCFGPQTLFTAVITLKIRSVKEQVLLSSTENCDPFKDHLTKVELQYIAVILKTTESRIYVECSGLL